MAPSERVLFKIGELDAKVDQLLILAQATKADIDVLEGRIDSLETTRTKQRTTLKIIAWVGTAALGLLGKVAFFSPTGRP